MKVTYRFERTGLSEQTSTVYRPVMAIALGHVEPSIRDVTELHFQIGGIGNGVS